MKSKPRARRRYDASGRQEQARATRETIVDAAIALLRRIPPNELTYADVARDAGIAMRTVYRHFPTPEDLFAAALERFLGDVLGSSSLSGRSIAELTTVLERFHARLSAEPGLYRLFFALPARSGIGMAAVVEEVCRNALERIPRKHHHAVCAAVELMLGPYAWETFHTHWAVSPAQMTRTILASVQALLDYFVAHPEALDHGADKPPMFRARPTHEKRAPR